MECIRVVLDNPEAYAEAVHGGVPEAGDLRIVSKSGATRQGRPAVVIAFTVEIDGRMVKVQTVTTLMALIAATRFLVGHHGEQS